MVEQYGKDGDPLGERIATGMGPGIKEFKDEPVRRIVGVAADVRSEGLDSKTPPIMYVQQAQLPDAERLGPYRTPPSCVAGFHCSLP
jgi:hypothetical protein